jgi:hypothetical protein
VWCGLECVMNVGCRLAMVVYAMEGKRWGVPYGGGMACVF